MAFDKWTKKEQKDITDKIKALPVSVQATTASQVKTLSYKEAVNVLQAVKTISEAPVNQNKPVEVVKSINPPIQTENTVKTAVNASKISDQAKNTLERVEGETIPDNFDVLQVESTIQEIINTSCLNYDIDDLTKAPQRQFTAVCMDIGDYFKKTRLLKDNNYVNNGSAVSFCNNYYAWDKVAQALTIFERICCKYNKAYLQDGAAAFLGMSLNTLHDNKEKLTPFGIDVAQKREASLASGAVDTKTTNITGQLAALNHWHGWSTSKQTTERVKETTIIYPMLLNGDRQAIGVTSGEK